MDTDRLKYFSVISETGSLTAASQLLGISHSGLSKSIGVLEEELGIKLFRPLGRGLEITEEGKLIYQKSKKLLADIEDMKKTSLHPKVNEIKIGLSEVLGATCTEFISDELKLPLEISQGDLGDIEQNILSSKLDFGILFSLSPQKDLDHLIIGKMEFNAYAREDLIKTYPTDNIPFIVPSSQFTNNPMGYKTRDGWPLEINRNAFYKVNNFAISLSLVLKGKGATYMPNFVASIHNEESKMKLKKVKVFEEAKSVRNVYLLKRKGDIETVSMKKAARIIRRLCSLS